MISYDEQHLLRHPIIRGAYFTIVGDFDRYGRPQVVNYLMNRRRDWRNNYELAYRRFQSRPEIEFQLLNYAYVPFEHISNTPSHLLALHYPDIDAIHDESVSFKRELANCLLYFSNTYSMPLYVPYKVDNTVSEEVWNSIVLPTIVCLYGKNRARNSVIMPSIVISNHERM